MKVTGLKDTIDWYDEHSEQYAQAGASYFDMNHISTFTHELPEGGLVLDAGCGPGRDAHILSDQGLHVIGIDLSKGLLRIAEHNYPDIKFIQGDIRAMPFKDASFDGVWSNTSLLHLETIEDVAMALSELARVLKPLGIIHVVVKSQIDDKKTNIISDKLSGHDRFFQYFKFDEMKRLLENAGFVILKSKEYSEVETIPHGRPEVRLIWCLAKKI